MDRTQLLLAVAAGLFALGLLGVIVRRNVLVMLMCMELMLNGVNLSLVTFAQQTATTAGAPFGIARFSVEFLTEYWLHFELTSVLLLAAVVAALAVIKVSRRKASHG